MAEALRGEMLCKPFFFNLAFLGKASHPKGNVMLTDLELLEMEIENNPEFKNDLIDYLHSNSVSSSESNILDFGVSSSATVFDDGTTENENLSEQDSENEEPETQTIVVYETTNYTDQLNGLLSNTYFIVYFMFAFFIVGALLLVIKFLKSFF